jgi:hypothetical protein
MKYFYTRFSVCTLLVLCVVTSACVVVPAESSDARFYRTPIHRCDDAAHGPGAVTGQFSGVYTISFEKSVLVVDGKACKVWLRGNVKELWEAAGGFHKGIELTARITIEGILSAPGNYGHMGVYERELMSTRIIAFEFLPHACQYAVNCKPPDPGIKWERK